MSSFSLVLPHSVRITVTINTFVRSRSSLENHTRIQTQMGKVYICFQTKKAPKTIPFRVAHTYMAYIGEYLPPPPSLLTPGKDSGFATSWLRIKGLRKLCAVFESIYYFFYDSCFEYIYNSFSSGDYPREGWNFLPFYFADLHIFFIFFFPNKLGFHCDF